MPEIGSVGLEWYKTGTVNFTQGSTTVTGVGTQWNIVGIKTGDIFTVDDTRGYEIASVESDTSLTLVKPFQGASGTAQNYAIIRNFAATMTAELAARVAALVNKYESYIDAELNTITGPKGDPGWNYMSTWGTGRSYNAMDVVAYNNQLYIALLAHTSASSNAPGTSAATWFTLGIMQISDNAAAALNANSTLSVTNPVEDKAASSGAGMPSERYIDLQLPTSGGTYIAPADGWVNIEAGTRAAGNEIRLTSGNLRFISRAVVATQNVLAFVPVMKNKPVQYGLDIAGASIIQFRFTYAQGAE